ncbi:hypothetical protein [Parabacteroides sp. FAFU027]|uniref:hypothetical protein n=1 Tax=Parabacteroides sp. FAFU027 TaxID=2922715 RepID=UPI001FAEF602|nr:hypothetical protein [Parabacteroides sp. FAFU027]
MNSFWDKLQGFANKSVQSSLSLVKVVLFSRPVQNPPSDFSSNTEIVILGNGPSLLNTINKKSGFLQNKDLLAVNFAVTSGYFEQIQPNIYVAVDPAFFTNEEYCVRLFANLATKVKWPLLLFLPVKAKKHNNWRKHLDNNNLIRIAYVNITPVEGFSWLAYPIYKSGLGMPRPRNVLIPAIMQALRMKYNTIYVAGADHSWPRQVAVDDENRVYEDLKHFYSNEKEPQRHYFTKRLDEILESMVVAFRSYHVVEAFSRSINKKIYNITEGSFIDAFERKKI